MILHVRIFDMIRDRPFYKREFFSSNNEIDFNIQTRGSFKFESTIPYYTYYYYMIKYRTYAVKYGMQGCHYSNYYFYFCSICFDLNLTLSINEVKKSFNTITCLKSFNDNLLYPFITSPLQKLFLLLLNIDSGL